VAGISLFTYGKASAKDKPNQETGIRLHAASGKVSSQSASNETRLTADKTITVVSIAKFISVTAQKHLLMTAQGACLKLEGGDISVHCPGKVESKSTLKELKGPLSVSTPEMAGKISELNIKRDLDIQFIDADGNPLVEEPVSLNFFGDKKHEVTLDRSGKATIKNAPLGPFRSQQPRRR
jgi:uncharacterized protein (DUF2345 family)